MKIYQEGWEGGDVTVTTNWNPCEAFHCNVLKLLAMGFCVINAKGVIYSKV